MNPQRIYNYMILDIGHVVVYTPHPSKLACTKNTTQELHTALCQFFNVRFKSQDCVKTCKVCLSTLSFLAASMYSILQHDCTFLHRQTQVLLCIAHVFVQNEFRINLVYTILLATCLQKLVLCIVLKRRFLPFNQKQTLLSLIRLKMVQDDKVSPKCR